MKLRAECIRLRRHHRAKELPELLGKWSWFSSRNTMDILEKLGLKRSKEEKISGKTQRALAYSNYFRVWKKSKKIDVALLCNEFPLIKGFRCSA